MNDIIFVKGIRGYGYHGVLQSERQAGQEFIVDVELELPLTKAAATDALASTVDYSNVASSVYSVITGEPFDLIETLAERIAGVCLADHTVAAVNVTVHKPSAPITVPFEDVGVRIRRVRH